MVKITAFLPARSVDAVLSNLDRVEVTGYTLIGARHGYTEAENWMCSTSASADDDILETVVPDRAAPDIVAMIQEVAQLEVGTSRIVVTPVSDAIRIRNEERGESAIR